MLWHYTRLGWMRLWDRPGTTALLFVAISLATAASLTTDIVLAALTADPIPSKSNQLFYPRLNPLPTSYKFKKEWGDPTTDFTWPDAMAILRSKIALHASAMSGGQVAFFPNGKSPFSANGRFTTSDFFKMFGLRFIAGHSWSSLEDGNSAPVIVLASSMKRRLFGDEYCIGKTIEVSEHQFTVIGVTEDWAPRPLFYADVANQGGFNEVDKFFIPLSTAINYGLSSTNADYGWGSDSGPKSPKRSWLQVWVELESSDQVSRMREFLTSYSSEMLATGNYERPASEAQLFSLPEWLQRQHLVPPDIKLQFWMAQIFLMTCIVNIASLLMVVFLRRQQEVAIRRAIGSSRSQISYQLLVEVMLIGAPAGLAGAGIACAALASVRMNHPEYIDIAQMSFTWGLVSIALSIAIAALGAGVPILRLNYSGMTSNLGQES